MIGQKVSYQGNCFFLLEEAEVRPGEPVKALIRSCTDDKDERWVMFDLLLPLSLDEPHLKLPRTAFPVFEPNDVVAFTSDADAACVQLGIIQGVSGTTVSLQLLDHKRCKTRFTWLPQWTNGTSFRRHTVQPAGFEAVCLEVHTDHVLSKVTLTPGHMLDGVSLNHLEALGLSVDVKAHG